MPKRRRLLTPMKKKPKVITIVDGQRITDNYSDRTAHNFLKEKEASTPRSRLKGALLDVLEPAEEPVSDDEPYVNRHVNAKDASSGDEGTNHQSPPRQSYVLKLFDRSVDLSQFEEGSPLYPICRAWMINQPKANYKKLGKKREPYEPPDDNCVELPGPTGPLVPRIPKLLPEQAARNKDNINLDYETSPPPSREYLLSEHLSRWCSVRRAWLDQAARVESRYHETQLLLNSINNTY